MTSACKIFGEPESPGGIFHVNADAGSAEMRIQDVFAMSVVRGLFSHHAIEEPHDFLPVAANA